MHTECHKYYYDYGHSVSMVYNMEHSLFFKLYLRVIDEKWISYGNDLFALNVILNTLHLGKQYWI